MFVRGDYFHAPDSSQQQGVRYLERVHKSPLSNDTEFFTQSSDLLSSNQCIPLRRWLYHCLMFRALTLKVLDQQDG